MHASSGEAYFARNGMTPMARTPVLPEARPSGFELLPSLRIGSRRRPPEICIQPAPHKRRNDWRLALPVTPTRTKRLLGLSPPDFRRAL